MYRTDNTSSTDNKEKDKYDINFVIFSCQYYITGAISRFFRSEAVNNFTNDPNSFQESAVDNEIAACGHTEEEAGEKEAEEEQPLNILKVQCSPHPVVAWELCSSGSHGEPGVMDTQCKTQLTDSQDKVSLKGDDAMEADPTQTVDVELFNAENKQQKDNGIQSLRGDRQDDSEEGEMSDEDKADLENEDCDIRRCLRQEEEDTDEQSVQREKDVVSLASEVEGKSNVGAKQEGEVVIVGKQDNATNLTNMQSDDVKTEGSGAMSDGNPDMLTPRHIAVNDRLIHDVQAGEEKLSYGIEDKDCYKDAACTKTWVTVNAINKTGQEESGGFKNILPGICEGQLVASQGLNPPLSEEVQRGFPASNNEQWQCENRKQRFLERDPKECKTVLLPEEMEENSCRGCDNFLLIDVMEEDQKSKDDIQESFDLAEENHHGILQLSEMGLPRGKEPLVESVMQAILFDSVRTGIEHPEEETEVTSKEIQGGTEDLLVQLKINDGCKVNASEGDQTAQEVVTSTDETVKFSEHKMLETAKMRNRSPNLVDDFGESGLVRWEVERESTFFGCITGEIQEAGIKSSKSKNEAEILNLTVGSMSSLNTDSSNKLGVESEALVTQKQESRAIRNGNVPKSTAKDMTVISAQETEKNVTMIDMDESSQNSAQEVIDEETIDPWMQMLSQDTDIVKGQEESEPGLQMDWMIEPGNAEEDEISSDLTENEEQFMELSHSGGSEFRSHTEMSSCTEGPDFSDHARCGSGALKAERQLSALSESDGSNFFTPGPTTESIVIVETAELQQSHSREAGHLNQELMESQENFKEVFGSESEVGVTDRTGETERIVAKEDVQSSTEMDTSAQATKLNENILEDTVAISGDEVENVGSGPPRSHSEVSLEEENGSTECGSQGDPESAKLLKLSVMETPHAEWSEDDVDALPGLKETQVTTHLTKRSRHQIEVLFCSQHIIHVK